MATWREIERDVPHLADRVPHLADRVRGQFAMGINKTIATVRRDGSPRISAIELEFTDLASARHPTIW